MCKGKRAEELLKHHYNVVCTYTVPLKIEFPILAKDSETAITEAVTAFSDWNKKWSALGCPVKTLISAEIE